MSSSALTFLWSGIFCHRHLRWILESFTRHGDFSAGLSLGLQKLEGGLGTKLIDRKPGEFSIDRFRQGRPSFCRKQLEGSLDSMVGDLGAGKLSVPRRLRIGTALSVGFGPLIRACI